MEKWIQHISGQGKKWKVTYENLFSYVAKIDNTAFTFPKSEYIPTCPPEEWEDVTTSYVEMDEKTVIALDANERFTYIDDPQRGPMFIIERKKI